jgi:5-methylcytosine-specific restriction protein A
MEAGFFMPIASPKPCSHPGCGALVHGQSRCQQHQHVQPALPSAPRLGSTARGYGSAWQRARLGYLKAHALCVACLAAGRVAGASVVDHVIPHRGDKRLFWDAGNWQALCKGCHDAKTAREDGGYGNVRSG